MDAVQIARPAEAPKDFIGFVAWLVNGCSWACATTEAAHAQLMNAYGWTVDGNSPAGRLADSLLFKWGQ